MAIATFPITYGPVWGASNKPKPRILKTEFGDGYGQRAGDGLNSVREMRSVRWENLSPAEGALAEDFLALRGKTGECFYWTAPRRTFAQKWVCEDWEIVEEDPLAVTLTATFIEAFDP